MTNFRWNAIAVLFFSVFAVTEAEATVVHVARQGDTITSLAQEYYGDAGRASILRAVNRMPQEGEVEIAVGEPILIPEVRSRLVEDNETWQDIAQQELGTSERSWYLALANGADENSAPDEGQIITIPYLLPWSLAEGLTATINHFYPGQSSSERLQMARMLMRLNQGLRPTRMARGTRIVLPSNDLTILEEKRAEIEREQSSHRSNVEQQRQLEATSRLEQLPELLASGRYAELVLLAGRIAGASELTEAQQVTMHRYLGQAFLALDRLDLAEREFIEMLEMQPDFQFDQVTTSPTVLELLERARGAVRSNGGSGDVN